MGTFTSFKKAYDALKDSTMVGLAKVNSEFKTATFGHAAWDCSTWVRTYALFLEERLECFRVLKYDIEAERLTKLLPGMHSRTRVLSSEQLLEQLPALQQLLYRLIGCLPEGAAYHNFLVQYALALVLKESFKIYCAINDGIINLVDMFFDMTKHDAVKALNIYKRAGRQAENLADFYDFCKGLDLARNFQFPTLGQPPPSFVATMEEYIKEAPQTGSLSNRRMEYEETSEEPEQAALEESEQQEVEEAEDKETLVDTQQEPEPETEPKEEEEVPPLISINQTKDLLGLNEINPKAAELEESNALALAIVPPGNNPVSSGWDLSTIGNTSGWELALVTTPSNNSTSYVTERKLAGGFDKLLLDSLYEDDASRRQLQLQNAGYNTRAGYGYEMTVQNPFDQRQDPFIVSNSIAPPTNVQMTLMHQQQQQQQHQQQNMITMTPHHYLPQYPQQQMPYMGYSNPFGDPFTYQQNATPPQGNHSLI
ncbi:hypothetical protein TEA_012660 [Camellia sinensis var. sinensis]|uniref:AP180 N-terminal homology (ANTH) domain-containing protein n=1 Tax=Camellia sinensis var. sinensis TaxID=542762 RepID=A0A4S4E6S7_CAMSN|nr:hypothetical protein TEA_012660 [Camellia sinensis var. sinensis]